METTTIKGQLIRAFNKSYWTFDGKAFSTSWHIMSENNYHCFSVVRDGEKMKFVTGISTVSGEWLCGNQIRVISREFVDFAEGMEWFAEACAINNEAVRKIASDIQNNRTEAFQKLVNL